MKNASFIIWATVLFLAGYILDRTIQATMGYDLSYLIGYTVGYVWYWMNLREKLKRIRP